MVDHVQRSCPRKNRATGHVLKAVSNQPCSCINIATHMIGYRKRVATEWGQRSPRLRGKGCVNRLMIQVPACTSSPITVVHARNIQHIIPRILIHKLQNLAKWQSSKSVVSVPGITSPVFAQTHCLRTSSPLDAGRIWNKMASPTTVSIDSQN